jgi:hypothetical protein
MGSIMGSSSYGCQTCNSGTQGAFASCQKGGQSGGANYSIGTEHVQSMPGPRGGYGIVTAGNNDYVASHGNGGATTQHSNSCVGTKSQNGGKQKTRTMRRKTCRKNKRKSRKQMRKRKSTRKHR